MTTQYYLLLNYIFHDSPARLTKIINSYKEEAGFRGNFKAILAQFRVSIAQKTYYEKRFREFEYTSFSSHLDKLGIHYISLFDKAYPQLLREIHDPPVILFYKGNIQLLSQPIFSIVGTRNCTVYGKKVTEQFSKGLEPFFVIASGMAKGIDTIAHQTVLAHSVRTVGVIATGLDVIYPKENTALYAQMAQHALLVSEQPPGIVGAPYRFPQRNRIISGLAKGILVCEAGEKSGALITAHLANDQGREVFAVPGEIFRSETQGPHQLIREGVTLVRSVQDVLNEFNMLPFSKPEIQSDEHVDGDEKKILDILSSTPVSVDFLAETAQEEIPWIMQKLTLLELKQKVMQCPGNQWIRVNS